MANVEKQLHPAWQKLLTDNNYTLHEYERADGLKLIYTNSSGEQVELLMPIGSRTPRWWKYYDSEKHMGGSGLTFEELMAKIDF